MTLNLELRDVATLTNSELSAGEEAGARRAGLALIAIADHNAAANATYVGSVAQGAPELVQNSLRAGARSCRLL
ncbi:MAG: hypothetical protein R6U88_04805 [Candidatus Bipolaricaulota bacterium]